MAERIAILYEHHDLPSSWESLRSSLLGVGLGLIHPGLDVVITLDDEGERVYVSEEELERRVCSDAELRFQWWFAECESVYCRIRVRQAVRIVSLGMEGCEDDQLRAIGSALLDRVAATVEDTIGLVFDPVGFTEDYDWDRFFIDKERLDVRESLSGFPDVLVVPDRDLDRLSNLPKELICIRQRELVILSTGTLPPQASWRMSE